MHPDARWIVEGYNSHFRGDNVYTSSDDWEQDDIITIKLDCDLWNVTYYRNDKQVQKDSIESNKPYYFALMCCDSIEQTHLQVLDSFQL